MGFRVGPHFLKEIFTDFFENVMIVGVKFRVVFRLNMWQIVLKDPQSLSSQRFGNFAVFIRNTLSLNLFKENQKDKRQKTVLDILLYIYISGYIYLLFDL